MTEHGSHDHTLFAVYAVTIATGERRVMAIDKTNGDAEAFVKIAIARRGVDVEFYEIVPQSDIQHAGAEI